MSRATLAGVLAASVLVGPIAFAQDTDLDERIVVSARRAPAIQDDLPGQIGRLDETEIDLIKAEHISEALFRVPGVFIHRGNGQEHLTAIRSPVLTGGAGAGSFLFLEDGVPLRAAGFANVNGLFESHSEFAGGFEVTKGPGSALYGSNAVHGLINILTRAPFDQPEFFAEALGGSFGRYRGRVSGAGSYGDHGIWGGLTLLHEDGFREDSGLDQQKLTLRHDYEGQAVSVRSIFSAVNLNQETAGFVIGPDAFKDQDLRRTNPNPEAFRDAKAVRFQSRIDVTLDENTHFIVTPYARWTDMDFLLHFLPGTPLEENGHWSLGAQSALYRSFETSSLLVYGVDIEYTEGFLRENQERASFAVFPQGIHYDYEVEAVVAAPFIHGEWQATDRLRITTGLRAEYTHYDYTSFTQADTVGRFRRPGDRTDDFLTLTPKFGAVFDVASAHQVYGTYARGARAPQTTDLYRLQSRQEVGDIDPENLDSFELGARGTAGPLTYAVAGFFMDKRNFFFRDADGLNVPDGRTRHVGIEAEGLITLSETLTLSGQATYAQHTYRFDRSVSNNATESISFWRQDRLSAAMAGGRPADMGLSAPLCRGTRVGACGRLLYGCCKRAYLSGS